RFDLALALEYLSFDTRARRAWHDYLELDSSSPWAEEALRHLERLNRGDLLAARQDGRGDQLRRSALSGDLEGATRLAAQSPEKARQLVQNSILPSWGRYSLAGNRGEAARQLALARAVIPTLLSVDHDSLLAEALD